MNGGNKTGETVAGQESAIPLNPDLIVQSADLLPGDVLLYRPRKANIIQSQITRATGSPYTHAAIYLGNGIIADSGIPQGVSKHALEGSLMGSQCVAIFRSQLGFSNERARKLNDFVDNVVETGRFYDLISVLNFKNGHAEYFENQLDFIRENYGKVTSDEEFAQMSFFCSAFVVACYAVVGIIDATAQVAYQPNYFSPGHLGLEPTFGWLLGYLVPARCTVPADDPFLRQATLWMNTQDARWW